MEQPLPVALDAALALASSPSASPQVRTSCALEVATLCKGHLNPSPPPTPPVAAGQDPNPALTAAAFDALWPPLSSPAGKAALRIWLRDDHPATVLLALDLMNDIAVARQARVNAVSGGRATTQGGDYYDGDDDICGGELLLTTLLDLAFTGMRHRRNQRGPGRWAGDSEAVALEATELVLDYVKRVGSSRSSSSSSGSSRSSSSSSSSSKSRIVAAAAATVAAMAGRLGSQQASGRGATGNSRGSNGRGVLSSVGDPARVAALLWQRQAVLLMRLVGPDALPARQLPATSSMDAAASPATTGAPGPTKGVATPATLTLIQALHRHLSERMGPPPPAIRRKRTKASSSGGLPVAVSARRWWPRLSIASSLIECGMEDDVAVIETLGVALALYRHSCSRHKGFEEEDDEKEQHLGYHFLESSSSSSSSAASAGTATSKAATSAQTRLLVEEIRDACSPHLLFLLFIDRIGKDPTAIVDFLLAGETAVALLEFLLPYLQLLSCRPRSQRSSTGQGNDARCSVGAGVEASTGVRAAGIKPERRAAAITDDTNDGWAGLERAAELVAGNDESGGGGEGSSSSSSSSSLVIDGLFTMLIRTRISLEKLASKGLFPFDPSPLVRRLEAAEAAFDGGVEDEADDGEEDDKD